MDWPTDWGLRVRMGVTMLLIGLLYVGFLGVLAIADVGILGIVVVMGLFAAAQFLFSDRIALYGMGASEVSAQEYPELHATVERLSQQADLPKPTVAVADTATPNAFAAGKSPSSATVCVTRGLLDTLDDDELAAVIAHELAHVKNRDVAVMTIATFLSSLAFLVVRWGWLFGGRRRGGGQVFVAIGVSLVVWVLSFLLVRALSRYREYAADRGAARITGQPLALASALLTIDDGLDRVPTADLRDQADMNALFIVPIRSGLIAKLASTHPPTETRVERLRDLSTELETA